MQLVLITGGSQGLGEAMGIEFAKKGADIVLVSRSTEKLKIALQKVEVHGVLFASDHIGCPGLTRAEIRISRCGFDHCRGSAKSYYIM
jgi:NAD(P)-dependent dehydrogenase (short-subunit alcohol dehydrogenase family)